MSADKTKKRGLGRGLEAILQSPETDITSEDIAGNYVVGATAEIDIDKIETNPFQPRTEFDDMSLRELAASIKAQGVIQPVTVRKLGFDRYQLISGERRLRASKLAGLSSIPVFIRVANDEQMLEMALIENIHRENLNAIEVAISYHRLMEECQITQEQLSEKVGKGRTTIANFLRLLKLPPEVQIALRDGHISMGHARAIINVEDPVKQLIILQQIIDKELNVRQVEKLVRDLSTPKNHKTKELMQIVPVVYKEQATIIGKRLGVKVDIKRNSKGKGTLSIAFDNDGQLEKLLGRLNVL